MADYFTLLASQLGVSIWVFVVIAIWEAIWTAIAMWKSARNNHLVWFIVFLLVNLLAIPEIVYIILTRKKQVKRRR